MCYLNRQFKSPIWDKVFSQKNSIAQILVYEITYNEVTKIKNKTKFGNNGADTCSRQGRTAVLPEARILFLNALSDWRIFYDKMAGLQFRRKQNSHSHSIGLKYNTVRPLLVTFHLPFVLAWLLSTFSCVLTLQSFRRNKLLRHVVPKYSVGASLMWVHCKLFILDMKYLRFKPSVCGLLTANPNCSAREGLYNVRLNKDLLQSQA